MAKRYRIHPLTLVEAVATLREMDENIADMLRTAVRIGEERGWDCDLHRDVSMDVEKWIAAREVLATKIRAMRRAAGAHEAA